MTTQQPLDRFEPALLARRQARLDRLRSRGGATRRPTWRQLLRDRRNAD